MCIYTHVYTYLDTCLYICLSVIVDTYMYTHTHAGGVGAGRLHILFVSILTWPHEDIHRTRYE